MGGRKRTERKHRGIGIVLTIMCCAILFSLYVRYFLGERERTLSDVHLQIEVLNGTGESGLAMQTAAGLRRMGIDVLIVGDAESFDFEHSLLIDRKGNPALVRKLSRLIGCPRVLQQIQERPLVDATLIVGEDSGDLKIGGR
ncbi:MAG: LytR C-terminal domain-containing protein [bacterium]|nr:MAG: LytR C-terminal domain-containing protein [bacterium]